MGSGQNIVTEDITKAVTRTEYKDIVQNSHYSNNTEADKNDKIRPLVIHFN